MKHRIGDRVRVLGLLLIAAILGGCAYGEATRQPTEVAMEEFMIPAADPGVQLYVRNKRLAGMTVFRPDNVVLMVHGATYPGESAFDLRLEGFSWMDYLARNGYDVYIVDIRGYGKSTRPVEMEQAPEANGPIVDTATAARDCGAAVDFILARRGIAQLNLLGWSWGTMITALYTTAHGARINRLVLYAPIWIREPPAKVTPPSTPMRLASAT